MYGLRPSTVQSSRLHKQCADSDGPDSDGDDELWVEVQHTFLQVVNGRSGLIMQLLLLVGFPRSTDFLAHEEQ